MARLSPRMSLLGIIFLSLVRGGGSEETGTRSIGSIGLASVRESHSSLANELFRRLRLTSTFFSHTQHVKPRIRYDSCNLSITISHYFGS
jgi:hypothetical protein